MRDDRPHIVHVVYRFAVGGLENGVVNLVNGLPQNAWRHTVVSLTDIDPTFARRVMPGRAALMALEKPSGHAHRIYPRVWRLLRRLRPTIVHTRNLAALELAPVAWASGVPVRIHGEHGRDADDADGRNVRRQRIRRIYRPFVNRYIALSPDLASYLADAIQVPPQRIEQIFNGVDSDRFRARAEREPIEGCPFRDPRHRIVGTVGRLDSVKDPANLARAFVAALEAEPKLRESLRLVIVGEGAERSRVESLLEAGGVRDLAWLAGERHDIASVLRGFDVFALPSYGEGVSNTILEAMASGLPVVATRVGANAELVVDGKTGTLVPSADSLALSEAMLAYVRDEPRALAHGRAGRLRIEQRFSLQRMLDRYHQFYLESVAGVDRDKRRTNDASRGHASR